jgi:hypothetical protein
MRKMKQSHLKKERTHKRLLKDFGSTNNEGKCQLQWRE